MAPKIKKGYERIIISDTVSTTGKYYIFLGQHLVGGFPCYDICVAARTSESGGSLLARHYPSSIDPKAKEHALVVWDEFRDKMTAPRGSDQTDEPSDPMELLN